MTTHPEQWSEELQQATRGALKELAFVPHEDVVCFKHIKSGFGSIAVGDLLRGNLRMIDRKTEGETMFANADELIRAGWVID